MPSVPSMGDVKKLTRRKTGDVSSSSQQIVQQQQQQQQKISELPQKDILPPQPAPVLQSPQIVSNSLPSSSPSSALSIETTDQSYPEKFKFLKKTFEDQHGPAVTKFSWIRNAISWSQNSIPGFERHYLWYRPCEL